MHFLVIVILLELIWVSQYPKNINFKLLMICTINGFIQLSLLLAYSLKMVSVTETPAYFYNISIGVIDST